MPNVIQCCLVLGRALGHRVVQVVDVVDSHLRDQHPRAQSKDGGQQVLVLAQEAANDRPSQHGAEAEQESAGGTVGSPRLHGHVLQVGSAVEVQGGADQGRGQEHARNVLLGDESGMRNGLASEWG